MKYWRSLDQLADTPEFRQFVEREFPAGASEWTDPVSRRHFVRIMSASFLLAGLGLNRLVVPERFGLHLLDFIEGGSIPGDLFDDGDEMDLCPIMPGQINSDSHGLVCTWGTIVRH